MGELFYVSVIFRSRPWGFECAGLNSLCLEAAVLYSYCLRRELEVCSNRCLVPSRRVACSR